MFDLVFETAVDRFRRLFETFSRTVEFPTVIRAADAFAIDAAESQRSFSVRALFGDHTVAAALVAIDHQIFAHQPKRFDRLRLGQFAGADHRHPVAPQILAARRAAADLRQRFIFFTVSMLHSSNEIQVRNYLSAFRPSDCHSP